MRFGGKHPETTRWNSCEFSGLHFNNGSKHLDARGVVIMRPLDSVITVTATAAAGYGCVLDHAEFCRVSGSFSNAEVHVDCKCPPTVAKDALGLYLKGCQANVFSTINLDVCFHGIELEGETTGNVFTSIVSNNCDRRGETLRAHGLRARAGLMPNLFHSILQRGCLGYPHLRQRPLNI